MGGFWGGGGGGWVRTLWFDLVGVEIEIGMLCRFLVVRIGGFESMFMDLGWARTISSKF